MNSDPITGKVPENQDSSTRSYDLLNPEPQSPQGFEQNQTRQLPPLEHFQDENPTPQEGTAEDTSHRRTYVEDAPERSRSREIREWIISLVVAVALGLTLHFLVFQLVRVDGTSMTNTLGNNYIVFSTPATYMFRAPVRGEIVITQYPARLGEHFVKRVIGLPGETIEVKNGRVYINGNPLNEPYTKDETIDYEMEAVVIPQGFIFVMGDNRNNSNDSHSLSVGPIPLSYLQGKAHFILWPFSEFGALELPTYS